MIEIDNKLKKLIENNALGFATIDKGGNPHCIAVGYVKVVSKNQILITNDYMFETIKNIQQNNNVALVVWNKDWKENCIGYELKGITDYFTKGKWHEMIKKIPENKGESCIGAILVTINKVKRLA